MSVWDSGLPSHGAPVGQSGGSTSGAARMGKKDPPADAGEVRRTLILMQETAAMPPAQTREGHYPQAQDTATGRDMVVPRAAARGKKFWQVGGEDTEEVETLMHRATEADDYEPSQHGGPGEDDGVADGSRAGLVWRAVSSCCRNAHQTCRHARLFVARGRPVRSGLRGADCVAPLCSQNLILRTIYAEASARVFAAWCVTRGGWPCEQLNGRGQPYI